MGGIMIYMYFIYFLTYNYYQTKYQSEMYEVAQTIKKNTKKDDVLLVIGTSWSSEIPYYSERKALCYSMLDDVASDVKNLNTKKLDYINTFVAINHYSIYDKKTKETFAKLLNLKLTPFLKDSISNTKTSFEIYKK